MSVQQLLPTTRLVDGVSSARSAVRAAATVPVVGLGVDQLSEAVAGVAALAAQVDALCLSLLAEADRRQVARSLGVTGTDAWAARLTGANRAETAHLVRVARLLEERYDATREAFAAGAVNQDQVTVIVHAAEQLPERVNAQQRGVAEAALLAKAIGGMNTRELRQAARRMLEDLSRELADEHEAIVLAREEDQAELETWLTLADNGNGTFSGRFVIPELHGHLLRASLQALTSPPQLARNRAGEVVRDGAVSELPGRSGSEKLGHGFSELIEHLPTSADGLAGGFTRNAVTLLIHLDHQHLLDGLASARLDTGVHLSAGEARRLACNAALVPVVLGGASQVLDLGRERRLHSSAQRRALSVRHHSCAAEGCERPFAWCDIHHPHPWSHGGATDLANALPLCGFHHRRAHDPDFDVRLLPSGEIRYHRRR